MDQLLNMQMIECLGVGRTLRAARLTGPQLLEASRYLLNDPTVDDAKAHVAKRLALVDLPGRLNPLLDRILDGRLRSGAPDPVPP
jgi:UDP:flavonoid glycosyltransferase YjiC (YdhE family)